jgi:pimeloyl-ACP methyl ester carboxylesterase
MKLPLVLLPGMMCDDRLFASQLAGLGQDRQVIIPDYGMADSMDAMAADILVDIPPRFALGGVSMGGILAMEIMRQAPARVSHLALIDTNPFSERDEVRRRRGPQMEAVRQGRLETIMRDEMKPAYFTHLMDSRHLRDLCLDMALSVGPQAFIRQSLALRDRPDYSDTLRQVTCPTLILCGRHDALCPVSRHEAMKEMIPHARLCIVEDAGHLPTIEKPDEVTQALRDLLEEKHG